MASIYKKALKSGGVSWCLMWRDGAGRQHKRTFRRRKDAEAFRIETEKEVQDGTWREVSPIPMVDLFDRWLRDLEVRQMTGEVKASTLSGYRSGVRQFKAEFAAYRSDQLPAAAVQRWRERCAKRIAAGTMAPKSFNNGLNLLTTILKWARHPARSYLKHDPLEGQKRLPVRRPEAAYLEDAEMARLLGAVVDDPEANAVVHVALFAGLRRGEVFGLQWGDLEAHEGGEGGRLRVRRSVYQGNIGTPKTANSERTVDVPARVLTALDRHRKATAPDAGAGDFIFASSAGTPIDPDNWYGRRFSEIRREADLSASVGMHTLRHTYASLLIRQQESPKYISAQLGHSSTAFTLDTYGHLFRSTSTEAMGRLNDTIRGTVRRRFQVLEGGQG